jgi:hypothetical protein
MSKIETLTIEWFTLEEQDITKTDNKDIYIQYQEDGDKEPSIIKGKYLFSGETTKGVKYICLTLSNSNCCCSNTEEIETRFIQYWAYCVEPNGID